MADYPFLPSILKKYRLHQDRSRFIVGITGPPASGKSTIAEDMAASICTALGKELAVSLNMDGYHYTNEKLNDKGMYHHKGSHFTFDVVRFLNKLIEIKEKNENVSCPVYDRTVSSDPLEDSLIIKTSDRIVVVEGNYLLLSLHPWNTIRYLMDYVVYIEVDQEEQFRRLLSRHVGIFKNEKAARDKIIRTDLPNTELIDTDKRRADFIFKPGVKVDR